MKLSHEERFLRILFPVEPEILGHRMTQLTIGQFLLLRRLRCPLATVGVLASELEFGPGDLALALYVCSRDWRESAPQVRGRSWLFGLRLLPYLFLSHEKAAVAAVEFVQYVGDSFDTPPMVRVVSANKSSAAKPPRQLKAPFWAFVIWKLKQTGLTVDQALDVPVKAALWDDAIRKEIEQAERWSSEAEEQIQETIRQMRETAAAGKKEAPDA